MKKYFGGNGISYFEIENLIKVLKSNDINLESINCQEVFLVDGEYDSDLEDVLINVLNAVSENNIDGGVSFYITPRIGTISSWSSKATNICHNLNLNINRVERAFKYTVVSGFDVEKIANLVFDKMTQSIIYNDDDLVNVFKAKQSETFKSVNIIAGGKSELANVNVEMGLALSEQEIEYLYQSFKNINRNPTDCELYMFAQANSEHCRHKIFNANWVIDGKEQDKSLFKMIRNTTEKSPVDVLSAYSDNAAVLKGGSEPRFYPNSDKKYGYTEEDVNILIKVETHNHPTSIEPYSGASTGVGGEIRDEGATGKGGKPKAGVCGFTVSDLNIPSYKHKWENGVSKPDHVASALDIMIKAPIGGANYNNEFGRPNISGYFRTFEEKVEGVQYGYNKPIMIAGGYGNIKTKHIEKGSITPGSFLISLGGPSMKIGLGGGAASSLDNTDENSELDFASVQRDNAELERRCQEVIDRCWQMDDKNPIEFIHDVGAGGLSNAFPELVKDGGVGGVFNLRDIEVGEDGMTPLEIWCNESQERYVIAVKEENIDLFKDLCATERCSFSIVGRATLEKQIVLKDDLFNNNPVDLDMNILFGNTPKIEKNIQSVNKIIKKDTHSKLKISDCVERTLTIPAVGSKSFLVTIGDRSVTGLVARDQMIGKWQTPISDVGVTASSFKGEQGEAVAMGERTPLAIYDSAAAARIAVGEVITNMAGAKIEKISDIKMSANWMAASGIDKQDNDLYSAVKAVGEEFCPELGISIPVGKDSMSMKSVWTKDGEKKTVVSPLSLIMTGFSPVSDVKKTITPEFKDDIDTVIIYVDLSNGNARMGGSSLYRAFDLQNSEVPDISPKLLKKYFEIIQKNNSDILAYHDKGDGGLIVSILEMCFASKMGCDLSFENVDIIGTLFNEELGCVLQVSEEISENIIKQFEDAGISAIECGCISYDKNINIFNQKDTVYSESITKLEKIWSQTSYEIQSRRENPATALQEFEKISNEVDTGLFEDIKFEFENIEYNPNKTKKALILREQGVNGHVEMAHAFDYVGFECFDISMEYMLKNNIDVNDYDVFVACGGFSYGDVLNSGQGWAKNILFNEKLKNNFVKFFNDESKLALGICNGCQMLNGLKEIIPGAKNWPNLVKNDSNRFEARYVGVKVMDGDNVWTKDMADSVMGVHVAHGEGKFDFVDENIADAVAGYVDYNGEFTTNYPQNPNGTFSGVTSLGAANGRVLIMMPHPERCVKNFQLSWTPNDARNNAPWIKLFKNGFDFKGK